MADEENISIRIKQTFDKDSDNLETQINIIILRQQELQKYISTLDSTVHYLETLIQKEMASGNPEHNKIRGYRTVISSNIELLTRVYDTYQKFEEIKFKYNKLISENRYKYTSMIEIELIKLSKYNEKIQGDDFVKVIQLLNEQFKQNAEITSNITTKQQLTTDQKYQL